MSSGEGGEGRDGVGRGGEGKGRKGMGWEGREKERIGEGERRAGGEKVEERRN